MTLAKVQSSLKKSLGLGHSTVKRLIDWDRNHGMDIFGVIEIVVSVGLLMYLVAEGPNWSSPWRGGPDRLGIPWVRFFLAIVTGQFLMTHAIATFKKHRWAIVVNGIVAMLIACLVTFLFFEKGFSGNRLIFCIAFFSLLWSTAASWISQAWKAAFPKDNKSGDPSVEGVPA